MRRLPFQLEICTEDDLVVAYIVLKGDDGSETLLLLGSMLKKVFDDQPGVFERWKVLCKDVLLHYITGEDAFPSENIEVIEERPQ